MRYYFTNEGESIVLYSLNNSINDYKIERNYTTIKDISKIVNNSYVNTVNNKIVFNKYSKFELNVVDCIDFLYDMTIPFYDIYNDIKYDNPACAFSYRDITYQSRYDLKTVIKLFETENRRNKLKEILK